MLSSGHYFEYDSYDASCTYRSQEWNIILLGASLRLSHFVWLTQRPQRLQIGIYIAAALGFQLFWDFLGHPNRFISFERLGMCLRLAWACLHLSRVGMILGEGFLMGGQKSSGTNFLFIFWESPFRSLLADTNTGTHTRTNGEWRKHFLSPLSFGFLFCSRCANSWFTRLCGYFRLCFALRISCVTCQIRRDFSLVFYTCNYSGICVNMWHIYILLPGAMWFWAGDVVCSPS